MEEKGKVMKSSKAFFSELQEQTQGKRKASSSGKEKSKTSAKKLKL